MSDASSQLWTLIARARQLPAAERDAFLVRECAERPDLLAEARAILVLVEQNQDLFEADTRVPTAPPAASPAASDSIGQGLEVLLPDLDDLIDGHGFEFEAARCAERRGDDEYWIGPYRLIKLLGTGGFGAVFLAKRQEPIQFHVAIKVIQAGRASPAVLARFEQEREIIASLDHPGIARVIDAGTSPRGVPFVAIEYVPGEPLTTYCDRHQLTLEQRLEVFREVCDAVQHAHQRGVIHRDLKPGNILVRDAAGPVPPAPGQPPGPRKPVVKIIDWGIAKAMQPLRSTPSVKTEGQFSPMTLQYASPEQAGAGGISPRDLDVRTDVFSLGVILYELLTGTRPISETDLRMAAQFEQLRLIREAERPRASTRLSEFDRLTPAEEDYIRQEAERTGQAVEQAREEYLARKRGEAERIARERQIGLDRLRQRLRGDLDSILRKALELDRTRRYDSPLSLANDIGAFLRGDAVPAHDAGTWYRLSKFVRRNRVAVAAVGAVMLAIVVGGAVATWQWRVAATERDGTDELLRFVNTTVVASAQGEGSSARLPIQAEVLDRAEREFKLRFKDRPKVQARLRETIARASLAAGRPEQALRIVLGGADDPLSLSLTASEAQPLGEALYRLRRATEAVEVLQRAIEQHTRDGGPNARSDGLMLALRNDLGAALKWAGDYDAARRQYMTVRAASTQADMQAWIDYDLVLTDVREARLQGGFTDVGRLLCLMNARHSFRRLIEAHALRWQRPEEQELILACRIESAAALVEIARILQSPATLVFAIREVQDTLPVLDECIGVRHLRTIEARARVGGWLVEARAFEEAEKFIGVASRQYGLVAGWAAAETLTARFWLARALAEQGRFDEGVAELKSAIRDAAVAGADERSLDSQTQRAAMLCRRWGIHDEDASWSEFREALRHQ